MKNQNLSVQRLQIKDEDFFKIWVILLQPFINLRIREKDVLSKLLEVRSKLKLKINDDDLLDHYLFSPESRVKITEELDIKRHNLNGIISSLKSKNIIYDSITKNGDKILKIRDKIIPKFDMSHKNFKLLFDIDVI